MKRRNLVFLSLLIFSAGTTLGLAAPSARAQAEAQTAPPVQQAQQTPQIQPPFRVARLSFILGDAKYHAPGEEWETAEANLPIEEDSHLATANGRAEVEFDSGAIVRLAENSEVEFTKLTPGNATNDMRYTEVTVVKGTLEVTAGLLEGDSLVIDVPGLHVTATPNSRFRVDTNQGDSWAAVLAGGVQIESDSGQTQISNGHTFHVTSTGQASIEQNAPLDDFDRWASGRDQVLAQGLSQAEQYMEGADQDYSAYDYGMADLSSYGNWTDLPDYGYCWQPYGVAFGWVPFFNGAFVPIRHHHHFAWMSHEPWGWLPYHTGRWINAGTRGWMWQPGSTRTWTAAPVTWMRSGNQIAWAPAGAFATTSGMPSSGVITGAMDTRGVIRATGRVPNTTQAFSNLELAQVPRATSVSGPQAISSERGSITYDSATRTYFNAQQTYRPAYSNAAVEGAREVGTGAQPRVTRTDRPGDRPGYATPQYRGPAGSSAPRYSPPPQQHYSAPPAAHYSAPPAAHYSPPPASHSSGSAGSHGGGGHH